MVVDVQDACINMMRFVISKSHFACSVILNTWRLMHMELCELVWDLFQNRLILAEICGKEK